MLVLPAELFCMDEPTIFLDGTGRRLFLRSLERLRSRGCTITIGTHDGELLSATTDRRYRLGC
jgi:ABC-type Mn2+/Zn2+ transport system ATPase subunit